MAGAEASALVSVGIPTYNRERELERAIESVLNQTYRNVELVVSDNASTDNTEAMCRRLAQRDARLRYIRHPVNRGASANFTAALENARGPLFMWLGDDDWLETSDYVSRCASVLLEDETYSVVGGSVRYFEGEEFKFQEEPITIEDESAEERVVSYYRQVKGNGIFYGIMRKAAIGSIPMMDLLGGDWIMIAAMAFLGKIRTVDRVCINRSVPIGGANWDGMAKSFGLSPFQKQNPHLFIAGSIFADAAWRSQTFAWLPSTARARLAVRCSKAVLTRYYSAGHVLGWLRQGGAALRRRAFGDS
jgi:glycosyltransferase involved in cell wall biosynthesis